MIHATHGTDPEYAGNAALEVEPTGDGKGVTLRLDSLDDTQGELEADLTPAEALALADALAEAARSIVEGG